MNPRSGLSLSGAPLRPSATWRLPVEAERIDGPPADSLVMRGLAGLFLVVGVGYYAVVTRFETYDPTVITSHLKAFALIAPSEAAMIFLYRRLSRHVPRNGGLRFARAKVPHPEAVPVAIYLSRLGTVTGSDEGYTWIEGGTLYFRGLQTGFRLNRDDVPPLGMWSSRDRTSPSADRLPNHLPIPLDRHDLHLRFEMLDPFENHDARRKARGFQNRLAQWLAEHQDSEEASLLPPTDVHPALQRVGPKRFEGVAAGFALAMVNLVLAGFAIPAHSLETVAGAMGALAFLAALGLAAASIRFAWQEHRDLVNRQRFFLESQLAPTADED